MYIPIDDTQDYPFIRLKLVGKTQLNVPTNQVSVEPPKLLSQRMRKRYYKALATNSKNCHLSLWKNIHQFEKVKDYL